MFDRNTSEFRVFLAVMIVGVIGGGIFAGIAAAETGMLLDDRTAIDEDTSAVYVDVVGADDFGGDGPVDVEVTLTGYNSTDDATNNTVVESQTLTVDEGMTESFDYDLVDSDSDDYDELAVTAEVVTGDESNIESTDWGTLERVSGGGGVLDEGGSIGGIPIVVVGAVLVGLFVFARD